MHKISNKSLFIIEFIVSGALLILFLSRDIIADSGFSYVYIIDITISILVYLVPLVIFGAAVTTYMGCRGVDEFLRRHVFTIIIFLAVVITWGDLEFAVWLSMAHLVFSVIQFIDRIDLSLMRYFSEQGLSLSMRFRLRPAQMILISFSAVILVGTLLLVIPFSSSVGNSISFVDGLFMATSATCVTGLATISTSDQLSTFGQLVILALIQIGGLGIMTLSTSMAIFLGRSFAMKERIVMQDLLDVSGLDDIFSIVVDIVKYTFFIELWGAVILSIGFINEEFEFGTAVYYGIFHSISAFCNAGFSLFNTSLESFSTNPLIHGTIAILVTMGGLGFIVLRELREIIVKRKSFFRISLHTRIVLIVSIVLTLFGATVIFFGEFLHGLDGFGLWEKIQISLFQSVTLRTAGFNTVPLTNFNTYTIYIMAIFMFIGASPGSTGGGIKTTTLAILFQSIWSTLRGRKHVTIFNNKISPQVVVRATALAFISIIITSVFIFILMRLESEQSFLTIFFEVISASGTVGLSLGVTPYLSVLGKLAVSLLMLIGRIGPLTFVLAVGEKMESKGSTEYPDGKVMIG